MGDRLQKIISWMWEQICNQGSRETIDLEIEWEKYTGVPVGS